VERRKVENWLARECLRHWRREMKKKAHVSYLPMLVKRKVPPLPHRVAESPDTGHRGAQSAGEMNARTVFSNTAAGGVSRDGVDARRTAKNFVCLKGAQVNLLP
jgi:hypothetical protein